MKKYLLLSLLIPCMFNTVKAEPGYGRGSGRHSCRHYGYDRRGCRRRSDGYWGPAALTTAGLVTAAAASRQQPQTIIIEKEAERPKTTQADLLVMQMARLNNQLEIVREENRNLRAQLIETQRK